MMAETQEQETKERESEQEEESGKDEASAERKDSGKEEASAEEQDSGKDEASAEEKDSDEDAKSDEDEDSGTERDPNEAHLIAHLKDTHALEIQSIRQLERAVELAKDSDYGDHYKEHLDETHEHEQKIKERIESYDLQPSAVKDLTMRAGALGTRQLADITPDTPVKLAMHFYALENLEVAAYEILVHVAKAADDNDTAEAAEQILEQERNAAQQICESFEKAAQEMLEREPPTDPEDLPAARGSSDSDEEDEDSEEDEKSEDEDEDEEDESGPKGEADEDEKSEKDQESEGDESEDDSDED